MEIARVSFRSLNRLRMMKLPWNRSRTETLDEDIATIAPPKRKRRVRLLVSVLIVLICWLGVSLFVAYKLTSRRVPMFREPVPDVAWGNFETLRLETADGHSLGAWFHQGKADAPAVLLLHGNGGSRKNMLNRAKLLSEHGCSLLLLTLRAHGDSTGEYNDIGYGARVDVITAVNWMEKRCPGRPIVILGSSLGSAAALFASRDLGDRIAAYILESPYRDLKTAVWNRVNGALPPGLSTLAYYGMIIVSPLVAPHLDEISPVDAIANVPASTPVLILAGALDRVALPGEAEALRQRTNDRAQLELFEAADHVRMLDADPARYRQLMQSMLDRVRKRDTAK